MATKTPTKKIELPLNEGTLLAQAEADRNTAYKLLAEVKATVHAALLKRFEERGGCDRCRGRGWVVTWDTMDSMSGCYAEYGLCPNPECTEETRARTGLHPDYSKYDSNRGVSDPVKADPMYATLAGPLEALAAAAQRRLDEAKSRQGRAFQKGDLVVAVRGRKLPVGTVGRVAYVSANGGLLIKADDGQWNVRMSPAIGWANSSNLERVVR